jgi:hypothetical protein
MKGKKILEINIKLGGTQEQVIMIGNTLKKMRAISETETCPVW